MSEYDDLSDSTEVFEPDNSEGFHIEETEPVPDSIPEDTTYNFDGTSDEELSEADGFMKNNSELFEDTEVTSTPAGDDVEGVLHNPDSESMTIGKYDPEKNETGESYKETAEKTDSSYFDNDNYDEIQKEGNYSNEEMYEESGNRDAIENALDEGKDFQMPAKPEEITGATEQEYEDIQNKTGIDADELKNLELEEDNMRHLRDYNSYYDEQPLDKHEDEEWN